MLERITGLPMDDAYTELRRILLDKKCQILKTIPPYAIEVRQGSWAGVSPITMAKNLRFRLHQEEKGTRVSGISYWPMILKAALIIGYTACFFLWGFAIIVLSVGLGVPLIRTSYGLIFIAVGLLILILGLLHIYNYFRQGNATKQILNLLKARGSPLHMQIRRARIRGKR